MFNDAIEKFQIKFQTNKMCTISNDVIKMVHNNYSNQWHSQDFCSIGAQMVERGDMVQWCRGGALAAVGSDEAWLRKCGSGLWSVVKTKELSGRVFSFIQQSVFYFYFF